MSGALVCGEGDVTVSLLSIPTAPFKRTWGVRTERTRIFVNRFPLLLCVTMT